MVIDELWDVETANIIGAYATEADALVAVQRAINARGASYADTLALVREDDCGDVESLAIGAPLVARAQAMQFAASVGASRS